MIAFRGVHKSFGGAEVLRGLDLEVRQGERLFIIGTSGVGKSVTIKHVVGFLRPDAGEVWFGGQRVDTLDERGFYAIRKRCAMVFQSSTLFDSLSVVENVALPLRKHRGMNDRRARAAAETLLEQVGMTAFADRFPAELGDGLRKRVAIARSLGLEPEAVLLDEPTTGLDPVSAARVDRLIASLSATAVVVSHDLRSIFSVADRIAFLYGGVVHALGTPDEIRASKDPVLHQFVSGSATGPLETPGF